MNLTFGYAKEYVRSRIDELAEEQSDMLISDPENLNLDKTIKEVFCEAVDHIHLAAPSSYTEGITINEDSLSTILNDGVIDFYMRPSVNVLRFVSFKSEDSDIVVTEEVEEDSPEGRQQLNKYIRGRSDNPTLVKMRNSSEFVPHYRYYTTSLPEARFTYTYIPKATSGETYICPRLQLSILNYMTALVLSIYKDANAQTYFALAMDNMGMAQQQQ